MVEHHWLMIPTHYNMLIHGDTQIFKACQLSWSTTETGYGHGEFFWDILVPHLGFSDMFFLFQSSLSRAFTTGAYSGMDSSSCFSKTQVDSALKNGSCSQVEDLWFKASGTDWDCSPLVSLFFPPSLCQSLVDLHSLTTSTGNHGNRWVGPSAFHLAQEVPELVQ